MAQWPSIRDDLTCVQLLLQGTTGEIDEYGQAGVDQNVLQKWDSFRAEPEESVTLTALEQTTLLMIGMPHFS